MAGENAHKSNSSEDSVEENLATDYVPKGRLGNLPVSNGIEDALKKSMDKTKKDIEKFKTEILKKFKYVEALGVLPTQAAGKIEEEYEISAEDAKRKLIHVLMVIPEDKFKEIGKVRLEAIKIAKNVNDKLWIHVMTPVDIWNLGLDSKFDIVEALAMSFPILDKGLLGALRVAVIHKTLVLKKFEKYVTSYVIGGSLVTGTATATSDVDVFIIIDDTDVKRMSRLELKDKLRGIIYSYIQEATAIAGVKNILNVQVYLMTEFWEAVKDAHPVMFTFIRDGVPLYDRGAFLPWKSLLKMGKIKPSPEAIDMFMSSGDKLDEFVNRRFIDILMGDIYWGIITPTQGLLMLYGLAPGNVKETVKEFREVFVEKEKLVEKKYGDILEEILIKYYKGYEHGKIKKITGVELDRIFGNAKDYIKRLKELREQIEERVREKEIERVYKDVFGMLEALLKKKTESAVIKEFDEKLVKGGKFPHRFLEGLKLVASVRKEVTKKESSEKKKKKDEKAAGKMTREVDKARKAASEIVQALIEYTQRCDFLSMDRTRFVLKSTTGRGNAEVFFLKDVFVVQGPKIEKLEKGKLKKSNSEELNAELLAHKERESKIDFSALEDLKKVFGEFELVY